LSSRPQMVARACTDDAEWDEFVGTIPWATAHHAFRYGQLLASAYALWIAAVRR
jgi:hypothetical protein